MACSCYSSTAVSGQRGQAGERHARSCAGMEHPRRSNVVQSPRQLPRHSLTSILHFSHPLHFFTSLLNLGPTPPLPSPFPSLIVCPANLLGLFCLLVPSTTLHTPSATYTSSNCRRMNPPSPASTQRPPFVATTSTRVWTTGPSPPSMVSLGHFDLASSR